MLHDCTDTKYIECCGEEGEEGKVEMWEGEVAGGGGATQRGRWEKGREEKKRGNSQKNEEMVRE